jgi:hypothetical protein
MKPCPCCSTGLLRHARHSGIYWFCPTCRQEMPEFSSFGHNPLSVSRYRAVSSQSGLATTDDTGLSKSLQLQR